MLHCVKVILLKLTANTMHVYIQRLGIIRKTITLINPITLIKHKYATKVLNIAAQWIQTGKRNCF